MQHHSTANKTTRKRSTNTKADKSASGLRPDTPQNLTGEAKQTWLAEEINYVNELIPFLQGIFKESERGQIDRHQLMSTLILTEILLNRYACNLLAMQEREDRRRAVQEMSFNGKIYLLADIRRAKAGAPSVTQRISERVMLRNPEVYDTVASSGPNRSDMPS